MTYLWGRERMRMRKRSTGAHARMRKRWAGASGAHGAGMRTAGGMETMGAEGFEPPTSGL